MRIDDLPEPIRSKVLGMDGYERAQFCRTWLPVVLASIEEDRRTVKGRGFPLASVKGETYMQLLDSYTKLLEAYTALLESRGHVHAEED